eukprot:TRINITY_DN15211_c0_g1_i1.p1 TRINITY_DN15211_c0_g1~~TRINITY_DN15211_c0_g1_i1.p1  ORF type:complete len:181 (-),score=29.98 TRINITY_DN15211_c0_g1_i1:63-605(-)
MSGEQEPVSWLLHTQASIQSITRPAIWIPVCRTAHYITETWIVNGGSVQQWIEETLRKAVLEGDKKEKVKPTARRLIFKQCTVDSSTGKGFAQVQCFTKAGWLDIAEFHVESRQGGGDKLHVKVHSFSTGLFPLSIPGAVIANVVFAGACFQEYGMMFKWLHIIREAGAVAEVIESKRMT